MSDEKSKRSRSKSHRSKGSSSEKHRSHRHKGEGDGGDTRHESWGNRARSSTSRDGKKVEFGTAENAGAGDAKSGIACENCRLSSNLPSIYCLECNLVLCRDCDSTVHAPPALSRHQRRPALEASLRRKLCRFHAEKQVSHYCLHCNVCLCDVCIDDGLHQDAPHVVETVDDAYQKKLRGLSSLINGPLLQRYEVLQHEVVRIEGIMKKVSNIAGEIEAQTHEYYEGVLARLSCAKNRKLALCQSNLSTAKRMMQQINDIEKTVLSDQHTKDPLALLSESASIAEKVRIMLARKPRDIIDVTEESVQPNDLPREVFRSSTCQGSLAQVEESIGIPVQTRMQVNALSLHTDLQQTDGKKRYDNAVYTDTHVSLTETSEREARILAEANEEIMHWRNLVTQYAAELSVWNMVCSRCGVKCVPETINGSCHPDHNVSREGGKTENNMEGRHPGLDTEPRSRDSPFIDDSDQPFSHHLFVHKTSE